MRRRTRFATAILLTLVALPRAAEEACSQCHAPLAALHAASSHAREGRAASCAACHGGSAAHLSAPATGNIFNPARAERSLADATCLRCHAGVVPASRWDGDAHVKAGVGCASCHRIHPDEARGATRPPLPSRALLRQSTESETCYTCHKDVRRAQLQRSTHILPDDHRDARMECSACHDVHAAKGRALLRAPRVTALCVSCHDEKRGPFLWEHGPVREDCMSCHAAHGSNNTHLLTMRVPMLCQSCHAGDPHQTLASRSSSAWLVNRGCVNCHQMIHGSNHPSGITLQR